METAREIWFCCARCGRESYCDSVFERQADAEVMCPFCRSIHKLKDVRI
ncbi:MAG: hypothetical protein HY675_07575 [Chloroflexi bacterium]|nr:hypothetical protein [Chloroflexota bacterium]